MLSLSLIQLALTRMKRLADRAAWLRAAGKPCDVYATRGRLAAFSIIAGLALLGPAVAVAVEPHYLYASSGSATNEVRVYSVFPLTFTHSRTITVGTNPKLLAASPDGSRVYVANSGSNNVSVINTLTDAVVSTITVGTAPYGVAVSPDGATVYVSNGGAGTVSVIDAATAAVVATITVGANLRGLAFTPDGSKVLVAGDSFVYVINTASRTVIASITGIFQLPQRVVISPDGSRAYVSDINQHRVYFIDLATLATVGAGASVQGARGLAILPDGSLYATSATVNQNLLYAIDVATAVGTPISMGQVQDGEIAYFDSTSYSNSTVLGITVLNTANNVHTKNLSVSIATTGLLAGAFGNTVTGVVGTGSGTISSSVPVAGGNTAALNVTPASGSQITSVTTDVCTGSLAGNTYTTAPVVTRSCTVTANFAPIPAFSCAANSSPGDSTVINCTSVTAGGSLSVPGGSCGAPVSGNVTCSGATSATGTAPSVTLSLNGGALTVTATPTFTVVGAVGTAAGTVTPSQTVASGASAVLAVVPQTGYHVASITTTGCDGSFAAPNYTTAAITAACTVTANFAIDTFAIGTSVVPPAGGTLSCSPNPVAYGGGSTCTATANAGYTFSAFSGDCAGASCALSNVTAAKNVTATFTLNSYAITTDASPPAGGTVTCSPNPVAHGGSSTCTATANAGYTFSAFSGDCTGATCTLPNVTGPRSLTGAFTLNSYAIATSASPPAGGTVSCSPNPVNHGGSSTCIATANTGYTFAAFSGDCTGASCALSNVTAAKNVTATFTLNSYAITTAASPPAGGTVTCSPNPVAHGSTSTCTATANAGYTFSAFSGDCIGATCTLTNVTAARSVTGTFTLNSYTITTSASPAGGGTITCSPNPVTHGGDSTCTATPTAGFAFGAFSGDCTGSSCTLTAVTANRSVTASFIATTAFVGTTATGTGTATATIAGGGAACHFDTAATGFVLPTVPSSISRIAFPHGWFTFKAVGCTTGATLRVTIVWPDMSSLTYVKYRASAANQPGTGFYVPANLSISGNTVSFDVTDGGSGDDDLLANGEIRDPGGPAAFIGAEPVPLGGLAPTLALLMLLLAAGARDLAIGRARALRTSRA